MREKNTTIKITLKTKERIDRLREHRRESYDEILRKVLWILNTARIDPEKSRETLEKIDEIRKRNFDETSQKKEKTLPTVSKQINKQPTKQLPKPRLRQF